MAEEKPKGRRRLWLLGGVVLLCGICSLAIFLSPDSDTGELVPQSQITQAVAEQQPTAAPEETTDLPEPTATSGPTETPPPTSTPTETPAPTATPEPILLTGSGDTIVNIDLPADFFGIVQITGNAAGRYFGVTSIDENNNPINLLVNTTDPYDGVRPLDFLDSEHTTRFQVEAAGDWTIEVKHIRAAPVLVAPGVLEGEGDAVVLIEGENLDLALITGNPEGRYFGVTSYGTNIDLLVNETDPYDGSVILDPGAIALEIEAVGSWRIEITTK